MDPSIVVINGSPGSDIDVHDRGLQYGDGLFETLRVERGHPLFLAEHLDRLGRGCARLQIPFTDYAGLDSEVRALCRLRQQGILKIQLTRGSGERGYRFAKTLVPTRILTLSAWPEQLDRYRQTGVRVRLCATRLAANPVLAGIKHCNRLEQILARAEWDDDTIQEGLMLDSEGRVIEGTMSNLFVVKNGLILTPCLERCGVPGIMRDLIIELARSHHYRLECRAMSPEDLWAADEMFLTNSVIETWPIVRLEKTRLAMGPVNEQVRDWIAEAKRREFAN